MPTDCSVRCTPTILPMSRVAVMDVIIMQIALAEILSFPNIPVNVSLNE